MRIAWFTPFSTQSAIGEFSRHVTCALAEQADVEIWTPDAAPLLATDLKVVQFALDSPDLAALEDREIVIYNMGDHFPFHGEIHRVSKQHPGIVILHDRVLHHLFAALWLQGHGSSHDIYVERMGLFYGEEGSQIAKASLRKERVPVWESDEEVLKFPLFEEALHFALGAVTHSEGHARAVRDAWLGPVASLHLPCYADVLKRAEHLDQVGGAGSEKLRLLSIGHVNPNKQSHRIVEMLAADQELARRVQFTIVGPHDDFPSYVNKLRRLIAAHEETLQVEILGWRDDGDLERLMSETDIFVNLRHPVMESGSASLMRQLAFGKPVLCFDDGYFGELPEGVVAKAPVGDFVAAGRMLRQLVFDEDARRRIGAAGLLASREFSERRYADDLLGFIEESSSADPALRFLDRVGIQMGRMGITGNQTVFEEIADDFGRFLTF